MSADTHETETTTPAHAAPTLAPTAEDEGLSDVELSHKRGLSHRDGPTDPPASPSQVLAKLRAEARGKAKGGTAP
jgi:hypothetical protein